MFHFDVRVQNCEGELFSDSCRLQRIALSLSLMCGSRDPVMNHEPPQRLKTQMNCRLFEDLFVVAWF